MPVCLSDDDTQPTPCYIIHAAFALTGMPIIIITSYSLMLWIKETLNRRGEEARLILPH